MKAVLVAAAALGASATGPTSASARDLLPSNPYDARIIAANRCNTAARQGGFAPMVLDKCRAIYDETVRFERSVPKMTAAQRNTLIVAKGLSMMTLAGGYLNLDGVMSARVRWRVTTRARPTVWKSSTRCWSTRATTPFPNAGRAVTGPTERQ